MTDVRSPLPSLIDELQAILAGLGHARLALRQGDPTELNALWHRIDRCALQVDALGDIEKGGVQKVMLALLDELERTIEAFGTEHQTLGDRLKSTSRNAAAEAAYRQARTR